MIDYKKLHDAMCDYGCYDIAIEEMRKCIKRLDLKGFKNLYLMIRQMMKWSKKKGENLND